MSKRKELLAKNKQYLQDMLRQKCCVCRSMNAPYRHPVDSRPHIKVYACERHTCSNCYHVGLPGKYLRRSSVNDVIARLEKTFRE